MKPANEKIIDGVLHTREFGFSPWRPMTAKELTELVMELRAAVREPNEEPPAFRSCCPQRFIYQPRFVEDSCREASTGPKPGEFPPGTIIC